MQRFLLLLTEIFLCVGQLLSNSEPPGPKIGAITYFGNAELYDSQITLDLSLMSGTKSSFFYTSGHFGYADVANIEFGQRFKENGDEKYVYRLKLLEYESALINDNRKLNFGLTVIDYDNRGFEESDKIYAQFSTSYFINLIDKEKHKMYWANSLKLGYSNLKPGIENYKNTKGSFKKEFSAVDLRAETRFAYLYKNKLEFRANVEYRNLTGEEMLQMIEGSGEIGYKFKLIPKKTYWDRNSKVYIRYEFNNMNYDDISNNSMALSLGYLYYIKT